MNWLEQFLRQIDLFAKPFIFLVGNKKTKSTLFGGFLSVCILTVSFIYALYVLNMYFDKKVQPKLTQSIAIENGLNTLHVNENFFIFEMLIKGEPLKRYEKRVGKLFLIYTLYYEIIHSDGNRTYKIVPLVECDDPQFDGFLCVSSEFFKGGKDLYYEPLEQKSTDYSLTFEPCDKKFYDNCASEDEINDVIFRPTNYLQLFTQIVQYNTNERDYKTAYKQEFWYLDNKLTAFTTLDLFKGTTSITEGILFQNTESRDTIYDFKRTDSFYTNDATLLKRMGFNGYLCILFQLNQVHNFIYIQHAMITEILAQFMSIFNSMLLIGFVARMFAESNIVDDLNNILLKDYYKQTALKLVKRQEGKKLLAEKKKSDKKVKQNQENVRISSTQAKFEESTKKQPQDEIIIKLQNKIGETNFSEKQNKYFQLSFLQKFKVYILSLFGKHSLINFKSDKNDVAMIYKNLIQQSMKRINIFELYKDLIQLKMVMKLLLTKDQYAAIHFCGSDITSEKQISSQVNININDNKNSYCMSQQKIIGIDSPLHSQAFKLRHNLSPNYTQRITSSPNQQPNLINSNSQRMTGQKLMIDQTNVQSTLNNQIDISLKKSQQIEERDKIQNLNLRGDDYQINASEESIENVSDLVKSFEKKQQEIEVKPKLLQEQIILKLHTSRHLQEMDRIEEDISQRKKFLQEFLDKMSKQQGDSINPDISYIDKQIYSSLIFNDNLI